MDFNVQCCLAVIILMGKVDLHLQSPDSSIDRDKRDKQSLAISYTVLPYNYTAIMLVSFPDRSGNT